MDSFRSLPLAVLALLVAGCRTPIPPSRPMPPLIPALDPGGWPLDGKDRQPVLRGRADREQILRHRGIFREGLRQAAVPEAWRARWAAIQVPCILVVAFGSWCGDTHRELPDLLALMERPNPFIRVEFLGVYRDKALDPSAWPEGIAAIPIEKVPTFWLHEVQPGGGYRLVGHIVENSPRKGQRMGEAILDLLERMR